MAANLDCFWLIVDVFICKISENSNQKAVVISQMANLSIQIAHLSDQQSKTQRNSIHRLTKQRKA